MDRKDPDLEVWRVEVRAGKKELKDKYQIRKFSDFDAGIGDVVVNALHEVRYLADRQGDSNVSRQMLHPLWTSAQSVSAKDLIDYRSGLTPDQIVEIERALAIERYVKLCFGNSIGLGISLKLDDEEIAVELPKLVAGYVETAIQTDDERLAKSIERARTRLHFISDS